MLRSGDNHAALARIKALTRVIVGEHGYATPVAMAEHLAREIRGAALHVLADVRHSLFSNARYRSPTTWSALLSTAESCPDLWGFAVSIYGRGGVANACLRLQAAHDADVPLLLFAC